MARATRRFVQLDAMELELAECLVEELDRVLAGGAGDYFGRKLRSDWATFVGRTKASPGPTEAHLVHLEASIEQLRASMKLAPAGPVQAVVARLVDALRADKAANPGARKDLLHDARKALDAFVFAKGA